MANVLPGSCSSVYLELFYDQIRLSTATGTLVKFHGKYFLVTNRHVVTGRDSFGELLDKINAAIPNKLTALLYGMGKEGVIKPLTVSYDLYDINDNLKHLWTEHPKLNNKADLSVFRVQVQCDEPPFAYDLSEPDEVLVEPSDCLSVIGFPFGITAQGKMDIGKSIAIWTTGFLATDLELDYDDLPVFLIDSRTSQGQSGSPVVYHRNSGMVKFKNGQNRILTGGAMTQFLGVYSGRINSESDIGMVWKKSAIQEILSALTD